MRGYDTVHTMKDNHEDRVDEILTRGVAEVIQGESLKKKLLAGKKLRVKFGIDPTSHHIHLGRAASLLLLRRFQDLGHTVILIVGDFTGVIGDTSDKESERPMLSPRQVRENMKTYAAQAKKILATKNLEVRYNSKWLGKLRYGDIGEQADAFSLSDFISRENIKRRLSAGERVSLREVLYPLMQGYDSVAVRADVEIGGTDQKFNMLAGRRMQERLGGDPQDIIMLELLPGTDGRKMSSSWGNTIDISAKPDDMLGGVMRIPDELIIPYFFHCTRKSRKEIAAIENGLSSGTMHPRDAKLALAREITALYHGEKKAERAAASFIATFSQGVAPGGLLGVRVRKGTPLGEIALREGLVSSKTEWRRLVSAGAIKEAETGEKLQEHDAAAKRGGIWKIGKRRFLKIEID